MNKGLKVNHTLSLSNSMCSVFLYNLRLMSHNSG